MIASAYTYALTKGGNVVWDSITRQPAEPPDPSRWDGVMISEPDYRKLCGSVVAIREGDV